VMCGIDPGHRVISHQGVSDGSDRTGPLRHSHSARTEMFFVDAVLARMGLSHDSVLSFPIQNHCLASICGEMLEQKDRNPIINTSLHLSGHYKANLDQRAVRTRRV
jgi:hypothetical protein